MTGINIFLYDVHMRDHWHGVTVGGTGTIGTILYTTDGGDTWNLAPLPPIQFMESVFGASSSRWWAVGGGGTIMTSTNGGANWSPQTSGVASILKDVHCVSITQCWAVGEAGVILTTNDAGVTWTAQTSGTANQLNDVHFLDNLTGWVVGNSGTVRKTVDGGANWTTQSGLSGNVEATFFFKRVTRLGDWRQWRYLCNSKWRHPVDSPSIRRSHNYARHSIS
jgi:photosystem II stability/assembly factor-like uncharacterized protein